MSRAAISKFLFLGCRRCYSVAAAAEAARAPAAVAAAAEESACGAAAKQKEIFWMKDPKTGYWIPENRLQDAAGDPAELRAQLLSKNNNYS